MNWLLFPLCFLAVLCNVTMDEVQFHWDRFFGKAFKRPRIVRWMKPSISWKNKYVPGSRFLTWMLSIPLVFITDFWHFLKFVFLNCIFFIVITLLGFPDQWLFHVIFMNLVWGVLFETIKAFYGLFADNLHK